MTERIEAGPPVRLGSRPAGPPIRTGWDAPSGPSGSVTELDDLTDVELVNVTGEPSALVRDPETGVFHNVPLAQLATAHRGSTITYVDEPPEGVPAGARVGDFFHVMSGDLAGTVYEVREG